MYGIVKTCGGWICKSGNSMRCLESAFCMMLSEDFLSQAIDPIGPVLKYLMLHSHGHIHN